MPLLSKEQFIKNLVRLIDCKNAEGKPNYDEYLIKHINELYGDEIESLRSGTYDNKKDARFTPINHFRNIMLFICKNPLTLQDYANSNAFPRRGDFFMAFCNRFHFLMQAFAPPECFIESGQKMNERAWENLIRVSEEDFFRFYPFYESLRKSMDFSKKNVDIIDAGCGPHIFWSAIAIAMDKSRDSSEDDTKKFFQKLLQKITGKNMGLITHDKIKVRVCAIEANPKNAEKAQLFAESLGIADRVKIFHADAADENFLRSIPQKMTEAGCEDFKPTIAVSETCCPIAMNEHIDKIMRTISKVYDRPDAQITLIPSGMEILCHTPLKSEMREMTAYKPEFKATNSAVIHRDFRFHKTKEYVLSTAENAILRINLPAVGNDGEQRFFILETTFLFPENIRMRPGECSITAPITLVSQDQKTVSDSRKQILYFKPLNDVGDFKLVTANNAEPVTLFYECGGVYNVGVITEIDAQFAKNEIIATAQKEMMIQHLVRRTLVEQQRTVPPSAITPKEVTTLSSSLTRGSASQ